jgi:hypothetical protein
MCVCNSYSILVQAFTEASMHDYNLQTGGLEYILHRVGLLRIQFITPAGENS